MLPLSKGYCCSCSDIGSTISEYNSSDLVVFGEVLSISLITPLQTIDTTKLGSEVLKDRNGTNVSTFINHPMILAVKLKVLKSYKGAVRNQIITIFTPKSGASCGYTGFKKGESYLVFGATSSFILSSFTNYDTFKRIDLSNCYWTSNCNRTSKVVSGDLTELDAIKASKKP